MMKRSVVILFFGIVLAVAAYCGFYFGNTTSHRAMMQTGTPELAWLKKEFKLSDAEFERISKLHEAYMPQCAETCRRIDAKNAEIKAVLEKNGSVTPEIEQKLNEAAQIRVECQKMMLGHFVEVSKNMPPEQGKRYLAWVQQRTFLPNEEMEGRSTLHE